MPQRFPISTQNKWAVSNDNPKDRIPWWDAGNDANALVIICTEFGSGHRIKVVRFGTNVLTHAISVLSIVWRWYSLRGVTTAPADPAMQGTRRPRGPKQARHEICELCWGRNGHGSSNYVHRTMHFLDVISSVSRSSKCNKTVARADSAPPNPVAKFKRPTLRPVLLSGVEGRGGWGEAPKWSIPPAPETFALPLLVRGRAGGPQTLVCGGHNLKLRHWWY